LSATILYINTPSYLGGAEISLLSLMRNLDPMRYHPVLVTTGEGQLTDASRAHGIETVIQQFPPFRKRFPWRYPLSVLRLANTAHRHRAALVHANCPNAARHTVAASHLAPRPYIAHVRDARDAWSRPSSIRFLRTSHCVIVNSHAVGHHLAELGVSHSLTRVVYNPVEVIDYADPDRAVARRRIREELGIQEAVLLVGIVGQVQEIKGHTDLVQAAPSILARLPSTHFLVAGAAFDDAARHYEQQVRSLICELDLDDHFHLIGFRSDVGDVMQALDVLVVPSWQEAFGRVVVEGMAAGCPVVGANVGGIPEIIEDGTNGLLVQPHDPNGIADAVVRLAKTDHLRQRMVDCGYATAAKFSVSAHVDQVEAIYDSLLFQRGAHANPDLP